MELDEKQLLLTREASMSSMSLGIGLTNLRRYDFVLQGYTDTRTPAELLDIIADKGREADAALARLRALINGNEEAQGDAK